MGGARAPCIPVPTSMVRRVNMLSYISSRVTHNGAALYNATSALVTGNEYLTLALRALTSAELNLNANNSSPQPLFINQLATEKKYSLLIYFSLLKTPVRQLSGLLQTKACSYVDWVK